MKKYRALANGNVIHMSDEAAETLVPGVYERVSDDTPLSSEASTPVAPMGTETFPAPPKAKAPKGRKAK